MGIEIERKFRVVGEAWRAQAVRQERLSQGYVVGAAAAQAGVSAHTVRVRLTETGALLTLKRNQAGIAREEFEYPIPREDAEALLAGAAGGVVDKVRHHVMVEGTHFEVDEFLGANAGLIVAEVELASVDAPFARPEWLGREVSDEARYYNVNLLATPFLHWSAADQAA